MQIDPDYYKYFIAVFLLAITPGPTVLGVVSISIQKDYFSALKFIAGIITANAVFAIFSTVIKSIGFVLPNPLPDLMCIIGSITLFILGIKMLINTIFHMSKVNNIETKSSIVNRDFFIIGLLHHLCNPKTIAFFVSTYLSIVKLNHDFFFNAFCLGVYAILIDLIVLSTYFCIAYTFSKKLFLENNILRRLPIIAALILSFIAIKNLYISYSNFQVNIQ